MPLISWVFMEIRCIFISVEIAVLTDLVCVCVDKGLEILYG